MSSTRRWIPIILLLSGTVALCATEKRNYEVWGHKDGEVILMPHVAPVLYVSQKSGAPIPEKGSLNCEFKQEIMTSPVGEKYHTLVGYCENGITVNLTGIDLNH